MDLVREISCASECRYSHHSYTRSACKGICALNSLGLAVSEVSEPSTLNRTMRISSELQFPLMLLPSFCLRRPSDVQKVGSFDYANPSACQTCRPGKTCRRSDRQLQKISSKPKPHWSSLQRGLSGNECVHLCSVPAWLLPSGWRNGMRAEPWLPQPSRELEGQKRRRLRASRVAERRCTQLATDVFQALAMSIGSLGRCAYVLASAADIVSHLTQICNTLAPDPSKYGTRIFLL